MAQFHQSVREKGLMIEVEEKEGRGGKVASVLYVPTNLSKQIDEGEGEEGKREGGMKRRSHFFPTISSANIGRFVLLITN